MLVVFPLGLLATSFAFDIAWMVSGNPTFGIVSFWMVTAGVIFAVPTSSFGLIDWLGIPRGTRAKAIGMQHGIGNLIVTALFAVSWMLRYSTGGPSTTAMAVSALAVVIALFTAWMGAELVGRLSVGVDEDAHVDAPSSLKVR